MAWILRYAHDENGGPLEGHALDVLRNHVERGAAVRVAYVPHWMADHEVANPPYTKLIMNLDLVLSRPGAVLGQAKWTGVDVPYPYDTLTFSNSSPEYVVNLSTTGKVWRRASKAGEPTQPDKLSNWAMEWYCEDVERP